MCQHSLSVRVLDVGQKFALAPVHGVDGKVLGEAEIDNLDRVVTIVNGRTVDGEDAIDKFHTVASVARAVAERRVGNL